MSAIDEVVVVDGAAANVIDASVSRPSILDLYAFESALEEI